MDIKIPMQDRWISAERRQRRIKKVIISRLHELEVVEEQLRDPCLLLDHPDLIGDLRGERARLQVTIETLRKTRDNLSSV